MNNIKLWHGDCLELMKDIPDGSVDMILSDPPYEIQWGNKNRNFANLQQKENSKAWDKIIDTEKMFFEYTRILRPNGRLVLFSQEPYTSNLIKSAFPSLPFCYRAIWYKNTKGNHLMAKKAMVSRFEDICIFQKPCPKHDFVGDNPNRTYFKKVLDYIGFSSCKQVNEVLGHRKAEHCFYVTGKGNGSTQFSICTENVYNELISAFNINKMQGFEEYKDIKEKQQIWIEENQKRFPPSDCG